MPLFSSLLVLPVDNPLDVFFDLVPTGAALYAPVYDDSGEVIDFCFVRLNPAGQQMLGLPAQPASTLREYYPYSVSTGIFAHFCTAYFTGQALTYDVAYAGDGFDSCFRVVAQRSGELLVVNFTDLANLPWPAIEQSLRESRAREQAARVEADTERQRFYEVLMQLPASVAINRGPTHIYELVNSHYQQLFRSRQLKGLPLREALPELAGQGIIEKLDQVYATGTAYYELEQQAWVDVTDTGQPERRYYNVLYHPLRDAHGHVDGLLNFAYDVTAHVEARGQLQQLNQELEARVAERTRQLETARAATERQRQQWEDVFRRAPAAICILDGPAWVYQFVNPPYQAMFPGHALLGQPLLEALPNLTGQPPLNLMRHVYDTGEQVKARNVLVPLARTAGGLVEDLYFDLLCQARYNEAGQIDGLISYATDVTAPVLAQREREAQQGELQRIFEQAPVAIAVFRGENHIIELANDLQLAIWDRTREQALGKGLFELLPEVVAQGFEQILTGVMSTGIPYVGVDAPASFTRHGVREEIFVSFVHHPLREADGRISGVVAVITDTTEQVRSRQVIEASRRQVQALNEELTATNQELLDSNTRLRRTNVDLDNFIYTASHDLKAPIANIEGLLLLLRKQLPPDAQRAGLVPRVLGMMQESVERFRLTIAQLTDLTRLQQVHTESAQTVQLAVVIEDVCLDLAPLLEATSAQLLVDISACDTVEFAPQHLRSIVYNLLSNAVKYRHPDRVPQVQLRCCLADQQAVLEVQDNGLGLSEAQQGRLFELFQRLHAHVEGSGVGLYMVKRIVENAGGTITVRSELGVGSAFTVTLPA